MALKDISLKTNEAKPASKSDIPVEDISGTDVAEYIRAVAEQKAAEERVLRLRTSILKQGTELYYDTAVANPDNPPSSLKLRDEAGGVLRLSFTSKYSEVDPEAADHLFSTELEADTNDFIQFSVKASFDAGIFLAAEGTSAGPAGDFSKKIYDRYYKVIEQETARLAKDGLLPSGVESPLKTRKVATVKPGFHASRWKNFPSTDAQARVGEVVKNTITLTPVAG